MRRLFGAANHRIPRIEHGHRPTTKVIIVHTIEADDIGSAENWFKVDPQAVGAHIGVGKTGRTVQWADLDALVYHAASANTFAVGIENAGFASYSRARWLLHPRQLRALAQAIARIAHTYGLGIPTRNFVKGHYQYPAGGHVDPGPGFPWSLVMALARRYYRRYYG